MKILCGFAFFLCSTISGIAQCGYYFTSHSSSFTKVKFWDELNGVIIGYKATLLKTDNGGQSWKKELVPLFQSLLYNPLNDICITGSTTGYIVGNYGLILKTFDKGQTWQRLLGISGDEDFSGVSFWDTQTGIIVGRNGLIYKTSDGGSTWIKKNSGYDRDFEGVYCFNNMKGFAWGRGAGNSSPRVYLTTNGGEIWQEVVSLRDKVIYKMQFVTSDIGYFSTSYTSNEIYKTTDGGNTWFTQPPNNFGSPLCFSFPSTQVGFAGYVDIIKKTTDGAQTFSTLFNCKTYYLSDIHFVNNNLGYALGTSNAFAGGDGRFLMKTANGGLNWQILDSLDWRDESGLLFKSLKDLVSLNAQQRYVSATYFDGASAPIFVTRDGGNNWSTDTILSRDSSYDKIGHAFKNGGLVFNGKKYFYQSADSGRTWTRYPFNLPGSYQIFNLSSPVSWFSMDTFILHADGTDRKLLYTKDKAATWELIDYPPNFSPSVSMKFVNKDTGYVAGVINNRSAVYRTYNRGGNWDRVFYSDTIGHYLLSVDFVNDSLLIMAIPGSGNDPLTKKFFKTTNRGNTWQTINLPSSYAGSAIYKFDFWNESTGSFIDNNLDVYTTRDSAKTWFQQISGFFNRNHPRGIKYVANDSFYIYGDHVRLELLHSYIPIKPALIKGPVVVKKDSTNEYIIPLDLFAFDTDWRATGNAILQYDSSYPERVKIKWTTAGNYRVSAYTKNECGFSPVTTIDVNVTSVTSAGGNPASTGDFTVFPIPSRDKVFITFHQPYHYTEVILFDITGKLVFKMPLNPGPTSELQVAHLPKGIYILKLKSRRTKKEEISKIVVQ